MNGIRMAVLFATYGKISLLNSVIAIGRCRKLGFCRSKAKAKKVSHTFLVRKSLKIKQLMVSEWLFFLLPTEKYQFSIVLQLSGVAENWDFAEAKRRLKRYRTLF
jgi:hypothetical protein